MAGEKIPKFLDSLDKKYLYVVNTMKPRQLAGLLAFYSKEPGNQGMAGA
jgi:hypothetical protein